MVLQFPNDVCAVRRKDYNPANDRDNPDRSVQDRLMTDNVVDFPKATGLDDYYGIMGAYDLELTELTTKALGIRLRRSYHCWIITGPGSIPNILGVIRR